MRKINIRRKGRCISATCRERKEKSPCSACLERRLVVSDTVKVRIQTVGDNPNAVGNARLRTVIRGQSFIAGPYESAVSVALLEINGLVWARFSAASRLSASITL